MAALPSMMGFVPERSIIIIGIVPDRVEPRRLRIGPVVRLDLEPWTFGPALRTFCDALSEFPAPQALVYGVNEELYGIEGFLYDIADELEDYDVGVINIWWIEALRTGARWIDLDTDEVGEVASVEENPVRDLNALHGAKEMRDQKELKEWLAVDDGRPALRPRRYVESLDDAGETVALIDDAIAIAQSVKMVADGTVQLEKKLGDRSLLRSIACVARCERLHPLLVTLAMGDKAPIMREILAETARLLRGESRRRVLIMLAAVLSGNHEGMPSFYALRNVVSELEHPATRGGDIDELNKLMASHLWHAHVTGNSSRALESMAVNGLYWMMNWTLPPHQQEEETEQASTFRTQYVRLLELVEAVVDWEQFSDVQSGPFRPEHS